MIARSIVFVLAIAIFSLHVQPAHAQLGWMTGKESSASSKSKSSSWWPWQKEKKSSSTRSKPSTLSKMGNSTKNAWNKTVDVLNPFDGKSGSSSSDRPKSTTALSPGTQTEVRHESTWWPWSWPGKKEDAEQKKSETLRDWIVNPSPQW